MKAHDVSIEIFNMVDEILSVVVPIYIHKLENTNISLPYQWIDNTLSKSMKMDMAYKCIWYDDLTELLHKALEDELISETDLEDALMFIHLGVRA